MRIIINEDTTFLICDELGNVPEGAELGLYHQDTRFLCWYDLKLDGQPPILLTARATDYYTSAHFLTNPALADLPRGTLSLVRRRLVGSGMHEDIDITNHGDQQAAFALELGFDADFAHIFEVKHDIEVKKEEIRREGEFSREVGDDGRSLLFRYQRGDLVRRLVVNLTERAEIVGATCRFPLWLEPHRTWHL